MTKLILIDDHQIIIDGLKSILKNEKDLQVIDYANSGEEILKKSSVQEADLAIVDIDMPEMDGYELTEKLKNINKEIRVLILTMHREEELMKKMIKIGADGYLIKNSDKEILLATIRQVASGKKVYDSELLLSLLEDEKKSLQKQVDHLQDQTITSREKEILALIAHGFSNREIGEKLFISARTVDTHRTNLMNKLNIHNLAGLIRYAYKVGVISI
ncbi:MAG: response regulator transcription factor [Bacteroidota bacterium]|nr:response regulator transcription factor [Bacteroidota bacterium]